MSNQRCLKLCANISVVYVVRLKEGYLGSQAYDQG